MQGKASATDFGVSFSGYGRGLNSAGAYSNTPEGKVVMAAYRGRVEQAGRADPGTHAAAARRRPRKKKR